MSHFIILALGSNMGDRSANLMQAIEHLGEHIQRITPSPIYESPAMLPADAPADWDTAFLNMAIAGHTSLSPRELLNHALNIEQHMGRVRVGHWGPRLIDIDIIAYAQQVLDEEGLSIPHPGLLTRDFVLKPAADIAPDWTYPCPPHQDVHLAKIADILLAKPLTCTRYQ